MIFWIFVIIFAMALVALGLTCTNNKERDELYRLKVDKERKRNRWLCADVSKSNYKTIAQEYHEADAAYDEYYEKTREKRNRREVTSNTSIGFMIGSFIVIFFMLIGIICCAIKAPMERARLEAEYEVLAWEVQNAVYNNDDDVVGHKETFNQVREWNATLAKKQIQERNFWIGIFVPNIYSDLKPVPLPTYD